MGSIRPDSLLLMKTVKHLKTSLSFPCHVDEPRLVETG